jgi:hypothetical protein
MEEFLFSCGCDVASSIVLAEELRIDIPANRSNEEFKITGQSNEEVSINVIE